MSFDKSGVKNPTIRSYILFPLGSWTTATGWTLKGDSILNCAHNCMRKVTAYCFYNCLVFIACSYQIQVSERSYVTMYFLGGWKKDAMPLDLQIMNALLLR